MATGAELSMLVSGQYAKTYSSFASDIDLLEDCPWVRHAAKPPRMLVVVGGGAVNVELLDDSDVPATESLPDPGSTFIWPLQVQKILSTGTTATAIVAIW